MLPVMGKLAAAGRTQEQIQQIMSAAVDISAGGMVSMEAAADALSKTLDGQSTSLGKIVPQVRELTKEQLRNGDAIRKAANAYAGLSEETAKATGASKQLANSWGDFKEHLGDGLSEMINPIKNAFNGMLTSINNATASAKRAAKVAQTLRDIDNGVYDSKGKSVEELQAVKQVAVAAKATKYQSAKSFIDNLAESVKLFRDDPTANQDILGLSDGNGNYGLDAIQKALEQISIFGTSSLLDSMKATGSKMSVQLKQLYEYLNDYANSAKVAYKAEEELSDRAKQVSDDRLAARNRAWLEEVGEAFTEATKKIGSAKTLNELKKKNGELTEAGFRDAMYKAVWSAYETMVTSSSDPEKMEKDISAKEILAKLEDYRQGRSEKSSFTYTAGTTKDETPKTMQDWVAEITAEVTKARDKLDADARLSGKDPSSQDKTDAEADAAFSAIVKVLSDPKFYEDMKKSGNVTAGQEKEALLNDATIQTYLAKISDSAQWKEFTGAQDELSAAIKEFWTDAGSMSAEDLVWARSKILQAYKAVGDVHRLTEKEQEDFNKRMRELQEELDGADSPEKEADVRRQILELQTQYHQLSIDEERQYAETMNQLRDDLAAAESQRIKDLTAERVEMGDQLMQGLGDSARQAGDMVKEYFENNRQADVAEQQKLYEDGAISYEEYCDRVNKIDKEAAQSQYKIAMAQWIIQLAQATSNIALGVTKAIAEGYPMGLINGALVSAAGAVSIASIVANKPRPPSFETGGIVPGTSYTGDRVGVRVNSGEGVFTRDQMKAMGIMARTGTQQAPKQSVIVNNNAGRYAEASAEVDQNTVRVTVAEIMHSELRSGNMTGDIQEAQAKARGARYL